MMNPTQHDEALNWFVRLSDPDAPESAWLEFETWLEADADHRKAFDLIEQVWVALDEQPAAEVLIAPIAANDAAPAQGRPFYRAPWFGGLAATAAAAVLAVGLWPEISDAGRIATYTTDDAPREVVLSDGSRLSMNRHSALTVRLGAREREVAMDRGEVAFDVTHDADRPFLIETTGHEIRVLGTAFNVLSDGGRFSVGVQRGLVAVSGASMSRPVRLAVGQQLVQSGAKAPVVSDIAPDQAFGWREGVLIYREADLATVAEDLSRYLDKPVNVSESARALRFTGALRIGDEATMLGQLQDFVPIRAVQANDEIRLTARDGG